MMGPSFLEISLIIISALSTSKKDLKRNRGLDKFSDVGV